MLYLEVGQGQKKPIRNTRSVSKHLTDNEEVPVASDNTEVITIYDDDVIFPSNGNLNLSVHRQGNYEQLAQVSSSTEFRTQELPPLQNQEMQRLDQPFSDEVEMMRRTLERLPNKKEIIKHAMTCMQNEIDRITEKHNDHLRRLFDSHNAQISETKRKQWCYYCEQDAIYHCCWNTAYCSTTCQQEHWQAEHKINCRRKR
ncbi:hypothetical protein HHI36_006702 [Cryptolaemus montrouzieri]|uniref:MYND-type domain-containing protein n=1 Tax=Cryptolaemus montrouzieri TaxID=559131 RepID=A0ABD2NY70_9CUCU